MSHRAVKLNVSFIIVFSLPFDPAFVEMFALHPALQGNCPLADGANQTSKQDVHQ